MIILKVLLALISALTLLVAYAWAAPGDDRVARHFFGAIAVITLILIAVSFTRPDFDRCLIGFVIGVTLFLLVIYSLPMSVWRSLGLTEDQSGE